MKKFVSEFKEFISRGNVVDLAVGMIVGSAFTAIVSSLVNDVVMPVVGMLFHGIDFTTLRYVITPATEDMAESAIRYGLAAVLALAFYFLLPFDLAIRQALVILVFSPIGMAAPGFTGELKGNVGLSSAMNSLSIVISIVIIVTLLSVML